MPRHQYATVHELARIQLLSTLPGEALGKLAERMERVALEPGESIGPDLEDHGRFWLVLSGMLTGPGGLLRTGARLGGGAPAGEARAIVPSTVVTCDGETFRAFVAPLLESRQA